MILQQALAESSCTGSEERGTNTTGIKALFSSNTSKFQVCWTPWPNAKRILRPVHSLLPREITSINAFSLKRLRWVPLEIQTQERNYPEGGDRLWECSRRLYSRFWPLLPIIIVIVFFRVEGLLKAKCWIWPMSMHRCYEYLKLGKNKGDTIIFQYCTFPTQECSLVAYKEESLSRKMKCKNSVGTCKTAAVGLLSKVFISGLSQI